MNGSIRLVGLLASGIRGMRLAGPVAAIVFAATCGPALASVPPAVQAPPVQAPPSPTARTQALPPGWVWGVESDSAGNRVLVPVPPEEPLPPRAGVTEDPVERARGRLEMLRMALEAYHATHRPGLAVYPEARSMDELARILRRERTLPEGWDPGGVVTEFRATSTGYLIRVAAGREILTIEPPHRDNPLAMFWLPPHRP